HGKGRKASLGYSRPNRVLKIPFFDNSGGTLSIENSIPIFFNIQLSCMNMNSGLKVGALLLALTAILIFAGCTQPSTTTNPTPHPTATTPVSSTAVPTVAVDNQTLKTEL